MIIKFFALDNLKVILFRNFSNLTMHNFAEKETSKTADDEVLIPSHSTLLFSLGEKEGHPPSQDEAFIIDAFYKILRRSAETSLLTERLQFGATLILSLSSNSAFSYSMKTPSFGGSERRKELSEFIRAILEEDEIFLEKVILEEVMESASQDSQNSNKENRLKPFLDLDPLKVTVVDVLCNMAANIYSIFEDKEKEIWDKSKLPNPLEVAALKYEEKIVLLGYKKDDEKDKNVIKSIPSNIPANDLLESEMINSTSNSRMQRDLFLEL